MLNLASSFKLLSTIFTEFHSFAQFSESWVASECKNCTCNYDYTVDCQEKPCVTTTPSISNLKMVQF